MGRVDVFATLFFASLPAVVTAQDCKPIIDARKMPALTKLLDSAAFVAKLPAAVATGEFLVSVMTGASSGAFVIDSMAAQSPAGIAIAQTVLSSLKPDARNSVPAFRVRVVTGPSAAVHVEPSVLCAPKPQGPPRSASFTTTTVTTQGRGGPPPSQRPRSVNPRLKIGVNGEVLQVDLGAGTGYPDGDRAIRQSMEGQRFEPATLDGRPVQVWLRGKAVEIVR